MNQDRIAIIMKSTCLTKRNLSEKAANDIVDENAKIGIALYFYKCPFCSSVHMTRRMDRPHQYLKVS